MVVDASQARARVAVEATPLVDPVPGRPGRAIATFVWIGDAHTTGVRLIANKLVDLTVPEEGQLHRLDATTWAASYDVPSDWRCSYVLTPTPGGATADPLNPRRIASKFDVGDMSLAEMPGAAAIEGWVRHGDVPAGNLAQIRCASSQLGNERDVWIGTTGGAAPEQLLILLDGEVWATLLPVLPLLDNLVAAGAIHPTAVVMPESLGPAQREIEMAGNLGFVDFLFDLTGVAADRTGVARDPRSTIVAGQSLGGLTAAFATLVRPDVFGAAICQSPSLWWPSRPGHERWLNRAFNELPIADATAPRRIVLHIGTDEWVMLDDARTLRSTITAREATHGDVVLADYLEFSGGHDHACWHAHLARALTAIATTV